ncbi:metallophosphoesterase family protein [Planococcus sp. YIM B11945]|uniref:metallophosphoesterase family protein n=1 Tax=Planococcus sp. YIM B11945 TaxID=3435410 RepID=UPI003D7E3EE6
MKFAVITDVHGNAPALKAVLAEIDGLADIEHIFCLGDMIGIGPDTNQVLEMLFARDDVSMMTGNHDEAVLALAKGQEHPLSHRHVKEHHQWIAERIDAAFVEKLAGLPRVIQKTINNKQVLFTHYQIEDKKMHVSIANDPFAVIVEPNLPNLEQLFNGRTEDLICFGHHHPLQFFKNEETVFLNPGALGCTHKPLAPYAIVSVEEEIKVELKEAAYDNKEFLQSYEKLKVPEREFILTVFHGDQLKHQSRANNS